VSGNSAGVSLSYNAKNQITAMTYGGQTISSLAYADLGQTERTQAGGLSFFSSPRGVQIQKSAAQSTFYTRDNKGNLIGERLPGGARWYYLKDGLGSTVAVINESGSTVSNRYGYDPYGKSTSKSESVTNPWQFASGYLDPTGLYKFGARYYDPNLGRWTQQDAVVRLANYTYASDSPVNSVDPTGAVTFGICLSASAGFGWGVMAQGCIQTANLSSWGGTFTVGAGGSSPSATVGIGVQGSTANTISGLGGPFAYAGGSVGDLVVGSVSGFGGGGVYGGDASIGLGANVPLPFSIFGGYSYTWTV
jgi:RHS repeat-associated protein